jgi:nucleoside-diphosphate-sugar epimerase
VQLLDRVIAAYGQQEGLRYTLFRPFNWIGPKLDDIDAAKEGSSRVVTQFIIDLFRGEPINLVDGGAQKRCFTWVEDGIEALMRIIANPDGVCDSQIFNVGNPDNECSVGELARLLAGLFEQRRDRIPNWQPPRIQEASSETYYGKGYQDILTRKPSIRKAQQLLGWQPLVSLDDALAFTFDAFLEEWTKAC